MDAMKLGWRATFLEVSGRPDDSCTAARSSSAPPAQGARGNDSDEYTTAQRLYVETLWDRAQQLRATAADGSRRGSPRQSVSSADGDDVGPLLEFGRTATAPKATCGPGGQNEFNTASTCYGEEAVHSDSEDESDDEEDRERWLLGVRKMTEALLSPPAASASRHSGGACTMEVRPSAGSGGSHGQQGAGGAKEAVSRTSSKSSGGGPLQDSDRWASAAEADEGELGFDEMALPADYKGPITTMMICNLPCRIMQEQFASVVDSLGFQGHYDFLFVPMSHRRNSNLGYAFVNFTSTEQAQRCLAAFSGYQFEGTGSAKACNVRPARLQGAKPNMAQFSSRHKRRGRPIKRTQTAGS